MELDSIIRDRHSGSATLTQHSISFCREKINACAASSQSPRDCYELIQNTSRQMLKKQPNMALLRRINFMLLSTFKRSLASDSPPEDVYKLVLNKLDQLEKEIIQNQKRIIQSAVKLVASSSNIMTISYSSVVRDTLILAQKLKKRFRVFCLKSHPPDEGVKFAEDLSGKKIKTTLISDAEMAVFMPEINFVLIGADRVYENGFVNKAGSLPLLLTARHFNIPVYLTADTWKILPEIEKAIKFVDQDLSEIYAEPHTEMQIHNYYFERIPLDLVTKVICENGVFEVNEFCDWYLKV